MYTRLIPRLDIKGPNLVKGIRLEGLRVLGQPEEFARYYYEQGADELLYMDAVASLYGRNSLLHIVERTAREIFIPLTVGGGLRSVEDIRTVLRAGADKVAINTAAIASPDLIRTAARKFGSSTVVISIEAIKRRDGSYEAYTDCGRQRTGVNAIEWAVRAVELGAGEVMVTSVDREGTGKGIDLDLTRQIASSVTVPVIASGGIGKLDDVVAAVRDGGASAVSIASALHYHYVHRVRTGEAHIGGEGNVEFLRKGSQFSTISGFSIPDCKRHILSAGVNCRLAEESWG